MRPIVLIPARLRSVRLPGKPLADLHGEPMIVHVWRRAIEADVGPVVVACEDSEIAEAVRAAGGEVEMTGVHHGSGSDRIFEALERRDPEGRYDVAVNLQGDLPAIDPAALRTVLALLAESGSAIATLASPLGEDELGDPSAVKVRLVPGPVEATWRAETFTREHTPCDGGDCHHHIGVYAYRRDALARFVALPPSASEQRHGLEQLRALDAGMVIGVALVDTFPLGVDTPTDLARARARLSRNST